MVFFHFFSPSFSIFKIKAAFISSSPQFWLHLRPLQDGCLPIRAKFLPKSPPSAQSKHC